MAGEILREKREDLGIELSEVAESLKIGEEYLAAIENDAFGKLPVPVYTMGYIRCYAAFVGIDADPIIQFYREHLTQPQPSTIMPVSFSRKKGPRVGYVFALLAAVIIGFVFYPHAPKQENGKSMFGSEVTQKVPRGVQPGSEVTQAAAVHDGETVETAAHAGDVALPEKPAVAAADQHSLSVTADDTTWISISFENGRTEEVLLRPGQSKNWPFSGKALLKVGNAGGIEINLDGTDLGRPGSQGQVRNITLPAAKGGE